MKLAKIFLSIITILGIANSGFAAFPVGGGTTPFNQPNPIGGGGGFEPPNFDPGTIGVNPLPDPKNPRVGSGGGIIGNNPLRTYTETRTARASSRKLESCSASATASVSARGSASAGPVSASATVSSQGFSATGTGMGSGSSSATGFATGRGTARSSASGYATATKSATGRGRSEAAASSAAYSKAAADAQKAADSEAEAAALKACKYKAEAEAEKMAERNASASAERSAEGSAARSAMAIAQANATKAAQADAQRKLNSMIAVSDEVIREFLVKVKGGAHAPYPLEPKNHWDKALDLAYPEKYWNASNSAAELNKALDIYANRLGIDKKYADSLTDKLVAINRDKQEYIKPLSKEEKALASVLKFPALANGEVRFFESRLELPRELLIAQEISAKAVPGMGSYLTIVEAGYLNTPFFDLSNDDYRKFVDEINKKGGNADYADMAITQPIYLEGTNGDSAAAFPIITKPASRGVNAIEMHEAFHAGIGFVIEEEINQGNLALPGAPGTKSNAEYKAAARRLYELNQELQDEVPGTLGKGKYKLKGEDYFSDGEELANHVYGGLVMSMLINMKATGTSGKTQSDAYARIAQSLGIGLKLDFGFTFKSPDFKQAHEDLKSDVIDKSVRNDNLVTILGELATAAKKSHKGIAPLGPVVTNRGIGMTANAFSLNLLEYFMNINEND